MQPELIADYQCQVGEGSLWHASEKKLYWTDIPTGRLFRYEPSAGRHEQFYKGPQVGGFTFQADGSLLLFMEKGAIAVWRDGNFDYIIEEIPDERETRFNDVIADPAGRVFCGTMPAPDHLGRLYLLDLDGSIRVVQENIGISNGMGFTSDRKRMYYTDSSAHQIYVFDYDEASGEMSNRSVFVETPEGEGIPDGMTVDAEGYVWSARWDGWALYRFNSQGNFERKVEFPAKKVSSVVFGGDDLTDMYVTTAGGENKAENGDGAGGLFRLNLGIKGMPEFQSRIGL